MKTETFKGEYNGIKFNYSSQKEEHGKSGILVINLTNGVESTHLIKNWSIIRVMQYIESITKLV